MTAKQIQTCDVLIVGGGNAALCAALTARRAGAKVMVVESAPQAFRGGNSRHTRDIRYLHARATEYVTGPYPEEEFWDDLSRVTGSETNEQLARLVIRESADLGEWTSANGVRWQQPLRGTLHLTRTNLFMLGGGKAMVNAYYDAARRLGIPIAYETEARELKLRDGKFLSAVVRRGDETREISAKSVVIAAGGFEANIPWLKEYWGEAAENFLIRGTQYNQGKMLKELLEHGAKPVGDPRGCHAIAIDGRGPKFDGGIVTRLDCVPFGIAVNRECRRFYDEGEDFWPKRYAIWGGLIARQPDQIAYGIVDSKTIGRFIPSVYPPIEAQSVAELARCLKLEPGALVATVEQFNRSVRPGTFDMSRFDDCRTEGLDPPKSHWALPIDTPPFYGYPLRPGITFTYLGVTVNERGQVVMQDDRPAKNIFAAGEVMAGNILRRGYLAGFGLTIGFVFGRIAGREAARHALG
ncbi:MAG: tricarballylate dehydrogenase [Deltaproteobacteria bacterium RIFCSPLOWO2_12_FULL_60_16]|nr:MAG: tricarballylate dehydrogenase [Deltaproteobacteria bacterium RIFCSPLOWO2_12_FULL_60_16]